jgi:peptidyl-prolyl cis-trans isomerase C
MKAFPWRFAIYFILGLWLALDFYVWDGPIRKRLAVAASGGSQAEGVGLVARVYGYPITRIQLQRRLREMMFTRGEDWQQLSSAAQDQMRQLALEALIDDQLIRSFRTMNGVDDPPSPSQAAELSTLFQAELEASGGAAERMAAQLVTPEDLQAEARAAALDEQWIEEKIQHRLAEIDDVAVNSALQESTETRPQRWKVAHLFLSGHEPTKPDRSAEMQQLKAKLDAGEPWQTLALSSDDERSKKNGGALGWITAERAPADFIQHLQSMQPGQTSEVVRTKLGWHILRLEAVEIARLKTNAERSEETRARLLSTRRQAATQSLLAELRARADHPTPFVFRFLQNLQDTEPR